MRKKVWLYFVFSVLLLASCEREIPYTGEMTDPRLVFQARLAENDTEIQCTASRSAFFLDNSWPQDRLLSGFTFSVRRGEGEEQTFAASDLKSEDNIYFIPQSEPLHASEVVRISVSHPDFPTATACDTVVASPQMQVASCTQDKKAGVYRVRLRFGANEGFAGMIGLQAALEYTVQQTWGEDDTYTYERTETHFATNDPVFAGLGNPYSTEEGFNSDAELFCRMSDIRNREVEILISANEDSNSPSTTIIPERLVVYARAHSTCSYLYWKSAYAYFGIYGNEDIDLASLMSSVFGVEEGVQLYNNVENGYGVVCATSYSISELIFEE